MSRLLTAEELADRIGVHVRTVRRWRREQRIPFHQFGGRYRYDPDEIDPVLAEQADDPDCDEQ